mmetsp:Transcript_67870/g.141519  ORF Transcript_67870/g.141519 Transcript_67870/m.141519 type:complete len:360 (-) Transcript_67870:101-1180(-)
MEPSNRPKGDAFRQQKLTAWQPIMTPLKVVVIFFAIAVCFIPTGLTLLSSSNEVYEERVVYDGSDQTVDCSITTEGQGKVCTIQFTFTEDVDGPVYVYYEMENFYQNHRRYVSSRDPFQLEGDEVGKSDLETSCDSFVTNGSLIINPCGLIANSLFTDVFTLDSTNSIPQNSTLDESGIAWASDDVKFKQPSGFKSKAVNNFGTSCTAEGLPVDCQQYTDSSGQKYLFYYPDEDDVQYLYESYPGLISPIDGVTDEHFKVWMRPAALPTFRKLYGKVEGDFQANDTLIFSVTANYEVDSFDGSKALLLSTVGEFGGKNPYLGVAFVVVGCISLMFALLFVVKQMVSPRAKADASLLNWT